MRRSIQVAALVAASVSSPALADEYFAVTPSGAAEMLFPNQPQAVIGKLSSRCIDLRWTVVNSGTSEVTCEAPMNFGQSVLGQMLMGNSYSTPPRRFFRFNAAEINGISRVQASGWMELQMAFGQTKRTDFAGAQFQNGAMNFLASAGGKYPPGTTFPNHVFMGFDSENAGIGGYRTLRVTNVKPGLPAEKAGMQIGDVITRVAGKRFKTDEDYLDATAKAAEHATYEVELTRDGKVMKLTLDRALRPTWTEQVVTAPVASGKPAAIAAPLSVADELAKLAKLKSDGVVTDAEFEAQKKKLLGL
jgi:hypothetical protein